MKQTRGLLIALLPCLLVPDASLDKSPEIVGSDSIRLKVPLGRPLVLDCSAKANGDLDETIIYWLVNGSFTQGSSTSRISEVKKSPLSDGTVQRSLLLKSVTKEDLKSTFVCVVMNPLGVAQKHITLTRFRSRHLCRSVSDLDAHVQH